MQGECFAPLSLTNAAWASSFKTKGVQSNDALRVFRAVARSPPYSMPAQSDPTTVWSTPPP